MIKRIFENMTTAGNALLIIAIVFFTFYALAGTATILIVFDMLDKITGGESVELKYYWFSMIALVVFKAVCNVIADLSKHFAGFDIVEQIRERIILRLKSLSLGFYTQERLGEISTIIHKDVDNMEGVVGHMWSRMASDFMVALILGIGLFAVNWQLGLAMVSLLPIAVIVLIFGIKSGKVLQKKSQDNLADMVSLFVEYVKGVPLLKAFQGSTTFENQLKRSTESFGESSQKMAKSTAKYLGQYSLFLQLSFAVLATIGAYLVFRHDLPVFKYLMFIVVSRDFYKPFAGIETHWLNYLKVTDSYRRILTVLDAQAVKTTDTPLKAENFDIRFEDVRFCYEKGGFELKHASFYLKQNTLTALVGPSGSGKTTITNLLLRFWETQEGVISIGDIDICKLDYDELLSHISIVMQNVILFADTIYKNIKIGKQNASREEIIQAAKKAMVHDFIMGLPQGYDTPVGENGVGLSGGQKQRISIARAFLKDAPIVILDEMTSNVDPVNEAKIQRAISNLAINRTVLVIAHHLRTIQTADTIVVFDKGEIVQTGIHDKLVSQDGLYRSLWKSQEQAKQWRLTDDR